MNILIKSALIIDPNSPHNKKKRDILIEQGVITSIKSEIKADKGIKVVESENLCVSPGWFDLQANFADPGFEYKEDLNSGTKAAAQGGFTGVCLMPSTHPPLSTKSDIEYVKNKTAGNIVDIYPAGCVSHNAEGKELSEMYDMHLSGAIAFTDDKKAVNNSGLLLRALLYSKNFNGIVLTYCDDKGISADGKMNEGTTSTALGIKGMPALAEELMVSRNIQIAEYAGARIHIASVSTKGSVELIREAKAKKLKVTASVNAYNIALDDSLLNGFDPNYKVNPPLRTVEDIQALKKGIADGTIDVITSDHSPEDIESKKTEFDHAAFGMSSIEAAFALVNSNKERLKLEKIISALAINPRKILGIEIPSIKENSRANITLFDPEKQWTVESSKLRSKSKNNPFAGQKFIGKVIGVYNKKAYVAAT